MLAFGAPTRTSTCVCSLVTRALKGEAPRLRTAASRARGFSGTFSACALTTPAAGRVSAAVRLRSSVPRQTQLSQLLVSKAAADTRGREWPGWLDPLLISLSTNSGSANPEIMPVHFLFQETLLLCSWDYLLQDWYPLLCGIGSLQPGQVPYSGTREEA